MARRRTVACQMRSERREWRALTAAVETRALRMTAVLIKVLAALEDSGVCALPYKGPALGRQLYGDPRLRHFVDLDLVVAPRDARRALDCLEGIGWQTKQPIAALGSAAYMAAEQELALHSARGQVAIDLHWRVGPRFVADSLPAGDVLRRARPAKLLAHIPHPAASLFLSFPEPAISSSQRWRCARPRPRPGSFPGRRKAARAQPLRPPGSSALLAFKAASRSSSSPLSRLSARRFARKSA